MESRVVSDTEELGTLSNNILDSPGLWLVVTGASPHERSGAAEFQRESRRHGLLGVALVVGLVHGNGLDITINLMGDALTNIFIFNALSTVDSHIGTVGESLSHLTPNGTIGGLLLVARSDFSETAVRFGLISLTSRELRFVHATHGAIETTTLHDNDIDRLGWWRYVNNGDSSQSTGTHMELEEVSLFEVIESNTVELGSVSGNGLGRPFLGFLVSGASEESGPAVTEFEVETRRLGFSDFALVVGLVHPDFVEISSDIFFVALTEALSVSACSRGSNQVGTVVSRVVSHLHVTPDRSVDSDRLVARLNCDNSAPRLGSDGLGLGGLFVEFTGHGSIEAASGLGNNFLEFARAIFSSSKLVIVEGEFVHASINWDD